mgnify:CR=1 FL=1
MGRYKGNKFILISPKELQIPDYIRDEVLRKNNIEFREVEKLEDVIEELDILYMTRIQKERFDDVEEYNKVSGIYKIKREDIEGKCKDHMIILHPLPRVDEIDIDVDESKHALYFKQAANGVPVREAMYAIALATSQIDGNKENLDLSLIHI